MNVRTGLAGAALALLMGAGGAAAADGRDVDIVGLRLGMTVDEAIEGIRKYNPELKIQPPVKKVLQYRVGNQTRKTEPFVSYVFAVSGKNQADSVYVYFSRPPGEPRAIAISRLHNNFDPPITREEYIKALVDKYGEPSAGQKDGIGEDARKLYWRQWLIGEGKVQCAPDYGGGRIVEGPFGQLSVHTVEQGEVLLRLADPATGRMRDAKDPSECAVLLTYQLAYDPLGSASGTLIDVAAAVESERRMAEWIAELAKQSAPAPSAAKPKL